MKFGYMLLAQYMPDEPLDQKMKELLEQARAARESGFDMVFTGEHHLAAPYQVASTVPCLARIAAEVEGLEVGALCFLLPLHNPVELAEQIATLDAISGGRLVLGVALGYRDEEYAAFRVNPRERVGRLLECLHVMKMLWNGGEVSYEGRYYTVPRTVSTTLTTQKPHPPIWMGGDSDGAVRRAGRLGLPWYINPHATVATISRQMALFHHALAEAGHKPPDVVPMRRDVYVAETREQAWRECAPYLGEKFANLRDWGQDKALPPGETFDLPFEQLAFDRFIIGTPQECIAEIQRLQREVGVSYLLVRSRWPKMPHQQALRQIRYFGEKVIPHLRAS